MKQKKSPTATAVRGSSPRSGKRSLVLSDGGEFSTKGRKKPLRDLSVPTDKTGASTSEGQMQTALRGYGKYKGVISSVDTFLAHKQEEIAKEGGR